MWRYVAVIGWVLFFLGGCMPPVLSPFQVTDYSMMEPVVLAVGSVEVVSEVESSETLPHIEKRLPVSPEQALFQWAQQRFTTGQVGKTAMVVLIREASMTQQDNPSEHWYILDNILYEVRYKIDLVYQKNGTDVFVQTVSGYAHKAVPESSSLAQKEKVWQELINDMLYKVNQKVMTDLPPELILSKI